MDATTKQRLREEIELDRNINGVAKALKDRMPSHAFAEQTKRYTLNGQELAVILVCLDEQIARTDKRLNRYDWDKMLK